MQEEAPLTADLGILRDDVTARLRFGDRVAGRLRNDPLVSDSGDVRSLRPGRVARVMILDGEREHRHEMVVALHACYDVEDYLDGRLALDRAYTLRPDLILIDENVGPDGGLQIIHSLVRDPLLREIPFICTTAVVDTGFATEALRLGARQVLRKPFRVGVFLQAVSSTLNRRIEDSWEELEPVQRDALRNTLSVFNGIADTLSGTAELPFRQIKAGCAPLVEAVTNAHFRDVLSGVRDYDNYTYAHSLRVATFLAVFGHGIGLRDNDLMVLTSGGLMHDVGKIGIPHRILNKPGRLDDGEWHIMRSHVTRTADVLRSCIGVPNGALVVAEQHHEKLDGTGYPNGLKGTQINNLARMAAICDVFGALTDRRAYKAPMPAEKALTIMVNMGQALDPYLLRLFRDILLDQGDQLEL
ncbi:HD domain-containing phosphohydrolase [Insolitispirillum peregrinum]|uniref:HD domain-containing phosphohydrolase n=1 Tax=Insolitispirillum peregrinum TaxID=80876 RepID=UPI00361DA75D